MIDLIAMMLVRSLKILSLLLTPISVLAATPCATVDVSLPKQGRAVMDQAIARQLKAKRADISQSFRFDGWSILYVSTGEADDAYLFYRSDPVKTHYVTLWGGVATENEEKEILDWTFKNAPGIPPTLARCFAWHVTKK
jgi:hypothetical protein